MTEPSHQTKLIRATVVSVLGKMRAPASTSTVIDAVMARVESGDVQGLTIIDRHDVRVTMESLARATTIARFHTGALESTRTRRSGRARSRAARGSVTWSIPRPSGTSGEPAW